jgi:hypothetical protein
MIRWRFQWRSVVAFMVMFSILALPFPMKRGNTTLCFIVNTGFWTNWLVWLTIGFLIGTSVGGLATDDGETPKLSFKFSLRGILLVVGWLALLLTVVVYISRHNSHWHRF